MDYNSLWHFGDSYSTCWKTEKIFTYYIAKKFGLKLEEHGQPGLSNITIFSRIVSNTHKFKSGDIILVNWSFFDRIESVMVREDNLEMINNADIRFFQTQDVNKGLLDGNLNHALWLLSGIQHSGYESFKLFSIISSYFESINNIGIQSFHNYISDTFDFKWKPTQPQLNFEGGYWSWLHSKGWHNEESVHYTFGIQKELGDEYIKRMTESGFNKTPIQSII